MTTCDGAVVDSVGDSVGDSVREGGVADTVGDSVGKPKCGNKSELLKLN